MKSFAATDPPNHKGKSDVWLTPLSLISRVGSFDLDPCAYPGHKTAKKLITEREDGLKSKWTGNVWLNPPYSNQTLWIERLIDHGSGVALVFARMDTRWMQNALNHCNYIQFIKGRISFEKPGYVPKGNCGSPSCLLFFNMKPIDKTLGVIL